MLAYIPKRGVAQFSKSSHGLCQRNGDGVMTIREHVQEAERGGTVKRSR